MQLAVGGGGEESWWDSTDGESMLTLREDLGFRSWRRWTTLARMTMLRLRPPSEEPKPPQERSPVGAVCVAAAGHMAVSPLAR